MINYIGNNKIGHYLIYFIVGALIGVVIIQPVNDMVMYHLYEAESSSTTSWGFILDNLVQSFSLQNIKKTIYYMVVGGVIGLVMAFVASTIRSKLDTIYSLREELGESLDLLIAQGEGPRLEFKSSFRWDMNEKKKNKALEHVVLKTIAGFMNSQGGTLLIGVADDGSTTGLKQDYSILKRSDSDGFEQAVMTTIAQNLGTAMCQNVHLIFHNIDDNEICRLIIKAAPRPVYLTYKGSPQFYLRTGGGTRGMNIQEASEYISEHWKI